MKGYFCFALERALLSCYDDHKEVMIMKRTWTLLLVAVLLVLGISVTQPAEAADIQVEIDGQTVAFDQPPIIENDRVMVPMRALAEALGAEVGWDGERREDDDDRQPEHGPLGERNLDAGGVLEHRQRQHVRCRTGRCPHAANESCRQFL